MALKRDNIHLESSLLIASLTVGLLLTPGSTSMVLAAEADDVTVVDLTDLYTGAEVNHNCEDYLKSAYDDEYHWQECSVCGKIINKEGHNIVTVGEDTCRGYAEPQRMVCQDGCGYYKELEKKAHVSSNAKINTSMKRHYYECVNCGEWISHETCVDEAGNILGCEALGTCVYCGDEFSEYGHGHIEDGERCSGCGKKIFSKETYTEVVNEYTTHVKWVMTPLVDGVSISLDDGFGTCSGYGEYLEITNKQCYENDGKYYFEADFTVLEDAPFSKIEVRQWENYFCNDRKASLHMGGTDIKSYNYAPEFVSVNVDGNGDEKNYSKKASIDVTLREEWKSSVNLVYLRLIDSEGNILNDWGTAARNDTIYTKTFDVIAETLDGEKTLYIEAKDICGNTSSYEVKISHLDSKAPVVTSVCSSSDAWSKTKEMTFTCTDEGVGNVEIAFNSMDDFKKATKNGNSYSRTYRFTGDVYGDVKGAVYYRDGAGNITTQFVTISNLDNTAPTIESAELLNAFNENGDAIGWNIKINASDSNENVGSQGAGAAAYAVTEINEAPDDTAYQNDATIFIPKSGTYYLWTKDGAGNTSGSEEISIASDVTFNGKKISSCSLNGKDVSGIYYNGKRLRL